MKNYWETRAEKYIKANTPPHLSTLWRHIKHLLYASAWWWQHLLLRCSKISDSNNPGNKSEGGYEEDIGNLIYKLSLSRTAQTRVKSATSQPPNPPASAVAAGQSESAAAQSTRPGSTSGGPTDKTTATLSRQMSGACYDDDLWLDRYSELVSYKFCKGD